MTRAMASGNIAHINSRRTHPVMMGKFLFSGSGPVYVHTGLGTIPYEGNDYLGVGSYGRIEGLEETQALVPAPVRISLSAFPSEFFNEALNSAAYGDKVTLYVAYRNDDGSLIDDPWIFYRGRIESSRVSKGSENTVHLVIQHSLSILKRKTGTRYTHEEQNRRFPGDNAFRHIEKMEDIQLLWGRSRSGAGGGGGQTPGGPGVYIQ